MGRPRKIVTAEQALEMYKRRLEYQHEYDQRPDVKAKRRAEQIARLEAKLAKLRS